jgi:TRAP-type C4-dicarboxylate transport system permease small subunit
VGCAPSTRRAAAVAAEVLVAIALGGLAWWCWHHGVTVTVRRGVALSRIEGRWWAAAIAAATLAGILLLDAGRQLAITRAGGDWHE